MKDNHIFPFVWMRGEDEQVIRTEIDKIYETGIRSVCLEARPHPDYAGEGWWHDVDIVIDEAKKRNMTIWILDDAHFPTGMANNSMKDHPEKVRRFLVSQFVDVVRDPNLLVGFDKSDDASVYRVSEDLALVQTVDFFPPIADDPYTFGAIAATNALSDVYAMGGEPKLALNVMAVPRDLPPEAVHELLRGGYEKCYEAGVLITGGHSILDPEPKYGLAVTGFVHPQKVLTNSGARPGDVLLLTKPLGIGVLTTANKAGLLEPETLAYANRLMTTLNKAARDAMVKYRVHACTDVTGFGLLGHGTELAQGSGVELHLDTAGIAFIPEALDFARMGILPEGMYRNRSFAEPHVDPGELPLELQDLLYDPQTSGGLLMAVDPADAEALLAELAGAVPAAQRIGTAEAYRGGKRIFLH